MRPHSAENYVGSYNYMIKSSSSKHFGLVGCAMHYDTRNYIKCLLNSLKGRDYLEEEVENGMIIFIWASDA